MKQTFAKEGQHLNRKVGRYAHARQFKRMKRAIKRQRTIVGRLQREIERKAISASTAIVAAVREALDETLSKAHRIVSQSGQRKLYAWHAPEVGGPKATTPAENSRLDLALGMVRPAAWP